MLKPKVNGVNGTDDLVGLLFFSQILEELLFHHTLDSYKAPALNTLSRSFELKALAKQISRQTNRTVKILNTFILELEWSIKKDPVITGDQAIFVMN